MHSVLEQKTDEFFRAARQAGTTELRAAYAADALAALILGETAIPSPDVRVHLDATALERGDALPGERCHVDGVGSGAGGGRQGDAPRRQGHRVAPRRHR